MPTWFADGSVSGFAVDNNTPESGLLALTQDVIHLASAGSVDANGVTRLQYDVPGDNFRKGISGVARLQWTSGEVQSVLNEGRLPLAAMWVVDALSFPEGKIPKPSEILALGPTKVALVQSEVPPDIFTNSTLRWTYYIQSAALEVNHKYWVLVGPARGTNAGSYDWNTVSFFGDPDVFGRAVSVWGNRTPAAPTITSPIGDLVLNAGESFDLTFASHDPDALFGASSQVYTDCAGVQVQYAPRPTLTNPTPAWIDLPIATRGGSTVATGAGWYIEGSIYNNPAPLNSSGAYYFWALGTMPVQCGSNSRTAGSGILPAGDWQIRVRTFDYGHPYPRWAKPLASADGKYIPNSFPPSNTSPWSTPIKVTVASQVPPPIPLSPINNTALAVDREVTLTWKYRNTALPPLAQGRRRVEIREVGAADWTLVADSPGALPSFTLIPDDTPGAPPALPHQYLTDGGFEDPAYTFGTQPPDGWNLTSGNADGTNLYVTNPVPVPPAHTGQGYLRVATSPGLGGASPFTIITLRPEDHTFTFSGWTTYGPFSTQHTMTVDWLDSSNNFVGSSSTVSNTPGVANAPYQQMVLADLVRPVGAVKARLGVVNVAGTRMTGDRLDDFSVIGYPEAQVAVFGFTPEAGKQYEWRVQTTDISGAVSNYSGIARFWVVPTPASGVERPVPSGSTEAATLGKGKHRAFIYLRGGKIRVGELTGLSHVDWGRVRDDMSTAKVVVSSWDIDCGNLLEQLEPWAYELVIFRNNGYGVKRVWEGPLMLPTFEKDKVTVNAKDVMAYPYRRIIKQLMNDSANGDTVTSRAARILQNVLAPDDPNLLSYLTVVTDPTDPKQYRNIPEWSRTAFEEIDDMASNSGLDYTAVGRRIILWGTKNRIGTLPEFRDENLGASPIVSVYGMSMANVYAVSDGSGVYGAATRLDADEQDPKYGLVEMLSSSWASDSPEDSGTYTQEGLETVRASFEESAERSISHRYPPPVVVRIPDNTTLNPNTVIDIQQLVPGSVVPLRSTSTLRKVVADQKLDSIQVTEENGVEKITIVLSPFSRDDAGTDEETTE